MVAVAVDGPLGEYYIGAFRSEHASESLIVRGIDDRAAVVLAGESGTGLKTLTSIQGFGGADGGTTPEARSAAVPFTAIQVEQDDFMAQVGVARDRPGATAFGVARVTARDDYLEGVRGGFRQEGQSGGGSEKPAA
jgi:hypothetical protein